MGPVPLHSPASVSEVGRVEDDDIHGLCTTGLILSDVYSALHTILRSSGISTPL